SFSIALRSSTASIPPTRWSEGGLSRPHAEEHRSVGLATAALRCVSKHEAGGYFNAAPHFSSIARASASESDEVGGHCSIQANGRQASIISFECEVTPRDLSAAEMRGSSAELQALRTTSTCSEGSQRVATAHITSLRSDGSTSSSTTTIRRAI